MTTVLFGAKSSPSTALYIKDRNASEFANTKSVEAKSIRNDCYMDGFTTSVDTEREAVSLVSDVIEINEAAGFLMHGWTSNNRKVVQAATGQAISRETQIDVSLDREEKVLGLYWNTDADELSFKIDIKHISNNILHGLERPTKREFLGIIMSIFEPLGFLAPYTIQSRIIMQEIWITGIKWDEKLKDDEFNSWKC